MPRIVPIPRVDGEAARQRRKQPVPGNVCFPRVFPSPAANSGERVSIKGKEILNRFDGSTAHVRETDIRLLVWFIPSLLRLVHVTSQREGATNSYPGKRAFDSWSVHSLQTGKKWILICCDEARERERDTKSIKPPMFYCFRWKTSRVRLLRGIFIGKFRSGRHSSKTFNVPPNILLF